MAVDRLLEAIAELDRRPDGLHDLAASVLTAQHLAQASGQDETARVFESLLAVVLGVARDLLDPDDTEVTLP